MKNDKKIPIRHPSLVKTNTQPSQHYIKSGRQIDPKQIPPRALSFGDSNLWDTWNSISLNWGIHHQRPKMLRGSHVTSCCGYAGFDSLAISEVMSRYYVESTEFNRNWVFMKVPEICRIFYHLIWKLSEPIDCEVDFLLENPIGSRMSGMKLVDQKEIFRSQMRRISN